MKKITLFTAVLLTTAAFAQNFELVTGTPFTGLQTCASHLVDIDGDGDLDFFNAGSTGASPNVLKAELFKNNGLGNFILVSVTPFTPVNNASAAFGDLDGDNDLDLILTGLTVTSGVRIAELYTNNGTGIFTLVAGTPFLTVSRGDVVMADLDNDTDLDVIISGFNTDANARISTVYKNNGAGVFTVFTASPAFEPVDDGDVDVADIDGDGDLDLLVTGNKNNSAPVDFTALYRNDGTGVFTIDATASALFTDLRDSDADIADIDGDGDKDILINGRFGASDRAALLYRNLGAGTFSLVAGTLFVGANAGTVDFSDFDNDGDMDVILSGFETAGSPNNRKTRLYKNNAGTFAEETSEAFTGTNNSDIATGDVNNDGKKDIIIIGNTNIPSRIAQLYLNKTVLSTEDFTNQIAVSIYPNPAENSIEINTNNLEINSVEIIDATGKMVTKTTTLDNKIDISKLNKGVYLIKINGTNQSQSVIRKFIKK